MQQNRFSRGVGQLLSKQEVRGFKKQSWKCHLFNVYFFALNPTNDSVARRGFSMEFSTFFFCGIFIQLIDDLILSLFKHSPGNLEMPCCNLNRHTLEPPCEALGLSVNV